MLIVGRRKKKNKSRKSVLGSRSRGRNRMMDKEMFSKEPPNSKQHRLEKLLLLLQWYDTEAFETIVNDCL